MKDAMADRDIEAAKTAKLLSRSAAAAQQVQELQQHVEELETRVTQSSSESSQLKAQLRLLESQTSGSKDAISKERERAEACGKEVEKLKFSLATKEAVEEHLKRI